MGWYPTRTLATDIGLLALMAWLLTFIAHDVTHRTACDCACSLATTRRQLHSAQQRLVQEIEERETLQQSVDRARFHDAFTGLPNRYYFMDQLDRVAARAAARRGRRSCVFLIAIDRFQVINETLGHTAGDELMVQAGRRFQRAVPLLHPCWPAGAAISSRCWCGIWARQRARHELASGAAGGACRSHSSCAGTGWASRPASG